MYDSFGTHETLEILEFYLENNIRLCRLPSHTSYKLQSCDMGVFAPLKTAYRDQAERLYQGGAGIVSKKHFTSLYSPAREKVFTRKNITAAQSSQKCIEAPLPIEHSRYGWNQHGCSFARQFTNTCDACSARNACNASDASVS